jgi:hypothetical protein
MVLLLLVLTMIEATSSAVRAIVGRHKWGRMPSAASVPGAMAVTASTPIWQSHLAHHLMVVLVVTSWDWTGAEGRRLKVRWWGLKSMKILVV